MFLIEIECESDGERYEFFSTNDEVTDEEIEKLKYYVAEKYYPILLEEYLEETPDDPFDYFLYDKVKELTNIDDIL